MNPRKRSNSESFDDQRMKSQKAYRSKRYSVFAADSCSNMGERLAEDFPERFKFHPINWGKFPDGTDDITISGFHPVNEIAGEHVVFFASFHNNDVTLSQFSVLIVLLQSFVESLTIVLPFYPVGTNERVDTEGKVATANTYSILLSNLPNVGKPNRIMIYDIHALQNRFFFHSSTIPSLHSSVPLLHKRIRSTSVRAVCFPDDGAAKRFQSLFKPLGFEIIICGKVREGTKRRVTIHDGNPVGKDIVIVDDLVQTGGTLYECAVALKTAGAKEVNAFVAHAVFPNSAWKSFCRNLNGDRAIFEHFWLTNSVPSVTSKLPTDDVFEVLDLLPQIIDDLDMA